MRRLAVLIAFVVLVPANVSASAFAPSGDDCLSSLTSLVYGAGLDVNETVEIFGCRQLAIGEWADATVLDTRKFKRIIPEQYTTQIAAGRRAVLADVQAMLTDRRVTDWLTYDATTGEVVSAGLTTGNDAARGDYFRASLRGQSLMNPPSWAWMLLNEYQNGATSYLLEPDHAALAGYVLWYANRRDAALIAMTTEQAPMVADGFRRRWGYNTIPWPWQLADAYTIDTFLLWLIQGNNVQPTATPARTTEDQPPITDPDLTVWLSIRSVAEDGTLLRGACFEIIGPTPASNPGPRQTVCDGDTADAPATPGVVVLRIVKGHYIVSETRPPSGYRLNSEVQDFWTETRDSETSLTFVHKSEGAVAYMPRSSAST